jgi:SsrA-binding protein
MADQQKTSIVARNRKARHNFDIRWTIEAGIELVGTEVKSLREGKINLADAYAAISEGQVWLRNLHISPYKMAADTNHEPTRPRRLLLHKREIRKLWAETEQKGMTLVPLTLYFKGNIAKVELAVAAGRRKYDKREAIAKADADRRTRRATHRDVE